MNMLTYGRLGEEFAEFTNAIPEVDCRFVAEEDIFLHIKKYNAIAGFLLPDGVDISHVRWIHSFSAGVEYWVKRNDLHQDVLITRTTGKMGIKMGEYCLNYLLYFLKSTGPTLINQHKRIWHPHKMQHLYDKQILILGTGSIGMGIATILKPLAGKVTGVNYSGKAVRGFDMIFSINNLPRNLHEYYAVIDTLPLTPDTEEVCDLTFFKKFRSTIFMNVGRGATVNTYHLLEAIQEGYIKNAVLDVFEEEPLPETSPLWKDSRIIITPHHSANTDLDDVKESFPAAYDAFLNNKSNSLVVNKEKHY